VKPYGWWTYFVDGDVVFKSGRRSLSIRTDRTVRTDCKMALRTIQTVRFVKMIYGSWAYFVDGNVVFKSGHKSLSIRTNCKMALLYKPYGTGKWFTDGEHTLSMVMLCLSQGRKFVDPYGSYRPYELSNGLTDRTFCAHSVTRSMQ
jgi:hypothetical protein